MTKNRKTVFVLLGVVAVMIAVTYASVPLYRWFCAATGWGGTTNASLAEQQPLNPSGTVELAEDAITVRFDATMNPSLAWEFTKPEQSATVRLGEERLVSYFIRNKSNKALTGIAHHNVTPVQAGKYFNRIKCFCEKNKTLRAGEAMELPVLFSVDPKIKDDPDLKGIKTITLSYTYFKTQDQPEDKVTRKE